MFKNILVPLEAGALEKGARSLELAKALTAPGGKITVLTVVEHLPDFVQAELPKDFPNKTISSARGMVEKFVAETGVEAKVVVEDGHAAAAINHFAKENDNDLVIIASHKPELMDYVLGSTASNVVRRAKCSVLVTR